MPAALALVSALAAVALQRFVEWRYGTMGIVGLLFLSFVAADRSSDAVGSSPLSRP